MSTHDIDTYVIAPNSARLMNQAVASQAAQQQTITPVATAVVTYTSLIMERIMVHVEAPILFVYTRSRGQVQ